jgi:hypothetical protein
MKTKNKTKKTTTPPSATVNDTETMENGEKIVPVHDIRDGLVEARNLIRLVKQYALEAILYAREALDLDPSDFTAADEGEFDDDDTAKLQLASKLGALLEWSTEANRRMDRAVVDLYQHDAVAQAQAKIADAKWREQFDKDGNLKKGGKS